MAGLGGMPPGFIPLSAGLINTTLLGLTAGLRPGVPMETVVLGEPGSLFIRVGGTKIPLNTQPTLQPGQHIKLELVQQGNGFQLRITPQLNASTPQQAAATPQQTTATPQQAAATPQQAAATPLQTTATPQQAATTPQQTATTLQQAAATPQQAAATPQQATAVAPANAFSATTNLMEAITAAMKSLQATGGQTDAIRMAAGRLPLTADTARQLLSLFILRGDTGGDLVRIQQWVAQAAATGAIPALLSDELASLLDEALLAPGKDWKEALPRLAARLGLLSEAKLANAFQTGTQDGAFDAGHDLRSFLDMLQRQDGLTRFLHTEGHGQSFQETLGRLLDRLDGSAVQNMRTSDIAYQFIEIPLPPGGEIEHAQVHFFGEGRGGRRFDSRNATIVMDLSTTRLGDLWIHLAVVSEQCICGLRTTDPEAAEALTAASGELESALSSAGYPNTQVHVGIWNGDRLHEAADLMQRFANIDMNA